MKTLWYNRVEYNTIQYNTVQWNTIKYNTIKGAKKKGGETFKIYPIGYYYNLNAWAPCCISGHHKSRNSKKNPNDFKNQNNFYLVRSLEVICHELRWHVWSDQHCLDVTG